MLLNRPYMEFFLKKVIGILFFGFAVTVQAATDTELKNYVAVDLLYWQAREGGADNWTKTITSPAAQQSAELFEAPFAWSPGIRITAGYFFAPDTDAWVGFTHYNTTAKNQAAGIVYSSLDANYFANNTDGAHFGPSYQSANINWNIDYNSLNAEVGHIFVMDEVLTLHPHLGLTFTEINQNIKTNWYHPTTTTSFTYASENLKNNFSGVGPILGIDSLWPVFTKAHQSIGVVGNVATELVYGAWNFKDVYHNNQPTTITVNSNSIRGLSPMLNGLLGVQWSKTFSKSELSVRLAYEEQIWFNQMQIYFLDTGKMNRTTTFQGANLQFKLTC